MTHTLARPASRVRRLAISLAAAGTALAAALAILLFAVEVSTEVTPEDRQAVKFLLAARGIQPASPSSPRAEQIRFVADLQAAILSAIPNGTGIGRANSREPMDLLRAGQGLCYDRSRFIEKALAAHGFKARHAFLFKAPDEGEVSWTDLLKPEIGSHAVTDVNINGEWMVVGSNTRWLSLESEGRIWSLRELARHENLGAIPWDSRFSFGQEEFWNHRFKVVYGLYSRHGKFFPPYNRVPDFNVRELAENFRR